ncbi:DnaA N-terminal domain-containing protein [Thalassospira lucentensis]|uniref:DnaA N-terminal domain-containing protein n=1 Tax=Thalassospira lucentensis TaxID=168935 RepID=UPI003AA9350B
MKQSTATGSVNANDSRLTAVQRRIGSFLYATWIMPLKSRLENDTLVIAAPSAMHADAARNRFGNQLKDAFKAKELRVYVDRSE